MRHFGTRRTLLSSAPVVVVAAPSTTTWNPSDKSTLITLSNGNLTATITANFATRAFRSIASASSGKKYWEISVGPGSVAMGIGNSSADIDSYAGDVNSIGWAVDGSVTKAGSGVATWATFADGDTICIAVDFGNNRIWGRVGSGSWNNDGSANPATNTNGVDISSLTGPFLAMGSLRTTSGDAHLTANFGATSYAQTPPSGFGNL